MRVLGFIVPIRKIRAQKRAGFVRLTKITGILYAERPLPNGLIKYCQWMGHKFDNHPSEDGCNSEYHKKVSIDELCQRHLASLAKRSTRCRKTPH